MPFLAIAAGVSLAASAAGGAISAISAIKQGDYQAAVARNNADIARGNAAAAMQAGSQQQQQQAFKTASLVGTAAAAQGSSGLDVNTGSGVNVRATDEQLGNLSGLEIRSNAARSAYGQQIQATQFDESANNDIRAGQNQAFGTALSTIGSAAGMFSSLSASGAFSPNTPQIGAG